MLLCCPPAGAAHSTATAFEGTTTNRVVKKFLQSFEIIISGQRYATPLRVVKWMINFWEGKGKGLFSVPRSHTRVVQKWSTDQIKFIGVVVLEKEGAIDVQVKRKQARLAAEAEAAAAAAKAAQQGPGGPQAPPPSGRQRRTRSSK
jgi:hypothetical protein